MDGRTWVFPEGLRNTPSLLGVRHTLPLHWSGDLDELQDVEVTVRKVQGGTGLIPDPDWDPSMQSARQSKELDFLADYLASLRYNQRSKAPPPELRSAFSRGQSLFLSRKTRCSECHRPPLYTDLKKHNVGTGDNSFEIKTHPFDTPSLLGLNRNAPYLHDGRAVSLIDLLTIHNRHNLHGETSRLSSQELGDLVTFLQFLSVNSN